MAGIVPAMRALFEKLSAAWTAARWRRELHALSDQTLKDIGLRRSEIDSLYR